MKKYKQCAVAFIDILGFSNKVSEDNTFNAIYDVIRNIVSDSHELELFCNTKYPKERSYNQMYFSDSIIISVELENNSFNYFIERVISLQQRINEIGFLTRGCIAVGNYYCDYGVSFGPALVKAVKLEEECAKYPRVIIDKKSFEIAKDYCNDTELMSLFLLDNDNSNYYYLDYLSKNSFDDIDDYYYLLQSAIRVYKIGSNKIVDENNNNSQNKRTTIRDKYEWFKKYLYNVLEKKGISNDNLDSI